MASNARIFFAGVGTTFIILAVGFGGGLMMAKASLEPSVPSRSVTDRMPSPVRVVFPPASAETAPVSQTPSQTLSPPEPEPVASPPKQTQQAAEMDKPAERVERRKAEAGERARRKRYAERKAKREAARLAQQWQEQQTPRMQPRVMAFGGDDDLPRSGGLFDN
jgi:hypothetical protein